MHHAPRTLVTQHFDPNGLTEGQRKRLMRDAMFYDLIVKSGWRPREIVAVFGGSVRQIERRIKMFSRFYSEQSRRG